MTTDDPKLAWLNEEIGMRLDELSVFFKPHYRLTFVARNLEPAEGDADVVVSDDSMAMVIRALERRIEVDGDSEPAEQAARNNQQEGGGRL
jgi:hypothetical protein